MQSTEKKMQSTEKGIQSTEKQVYVRPTLDAVPLFKNITANRATSV